MPDVFVKLNKLDRMEVDRRAREGKFNSYIEIHNETTGIFFRHPARWDLYQKGKLKLAFVVKPRKRKYEQEQPCQHHHKEGGITDGPYCMDCGMQF